MTAITNFLAISCAQVHDDVLPLGLLQPLHLVGAVGQPGLSKMEGVARQPRAVAGSRISGDLRFREFFRKQHRNSKVFEKWKYRFQLHVISLKHLFPEQDFS